MVGLSLRSVQEAAIHIHNLRNISRECDSYDSFANLISFEGFSYVIAAAYECLRPLMENEEKLTDV